MRRRSQAPDVIASLAFARSSSTTSSEAAIVQPGVYATEFGSVAEMIPHGAAYEPTIGRLRAGFSSGNFRIGDPAEVVAAIQSLTQLAQPPLRFALGPGAHAQIGESLRSRLGDLERSHPTELPVEPATSPPLPPLL